MFVKFAMLVLLKLTRSIWASLVAQNLPAMWETWVRSLGGEDPLEKGMATHSMFLPGKSVDRGDYGAAKSWTRLND